MFIAYIGLGSNVGNKLGNMKLALHQIGNIDTTDLVNISPVFETEPMYKEDQDKFYNAVAEIHTDLNPVILLRKLKDIEEKLGRDFNAERNGPRIIDLDIEFFDDMILESDSLEIPHPRLYERLFVLKPMFDLNKNYKCSKTGKTIELLLQECEDNSKIEKIAEIDIGSL